MSRFWLADFTHVPGKHCGSTALSDVCRFRKLKLSEAFCFGLGRGLGFFSYAYPGMKPEYGIATRALNLEGNFFQSLGVPFHWQQESSRKEALEKLKTYLSRNIPVLVQVDLFYLWFYNTRTHFPGHVITVAGLDQEKEKVFVADTHFEGLKGVPFEDFFRGWNARVPPIPLAYNHFPVPDLDSSRINELNTRKALITQAKEMLVKGSFGFGASGIAAMEELAETLPEWRASKDASFCYRFAYQVIEKRGTGKGAFRFIYADFLKEVEALFPSLSGKRFSEIMTEIACKWQQLAFLFKEMSEAPSHKTEQKIRALLYAIARQEKAYYEAVLEHLEEE